MAEINIYDKANELEQGLRESKEYNKIKEQYEKVNANPETKNLFDEFREIQLELQNKQMQGEEISEVDIARAQKSAQEIEQNETIAELMQAEQAMSQLIQDINRVIMKPLEDIYGSLEEGEEGQQQ
nr:YlbF family regulator [Mammaliicoccus sp. Marseille-Q6498]